MFSGQATAAHGAAPPLPPAPLSLMFLAKALPHLIQQRCPVASSRDILSEQLADIQDAVLMSGARVVPMFSSLFFGLFWYS